jgi:hypothetical protein
MLVVAGLFLYGCQTAATVPAGTSSQQVGLWVNGEGKVTVVPDIASVQLGVEAQAVTVAGAQNEATAAMNRVMNALKAAGVAEKDIQTRFFNIQKVTRFDPDKQQETVLGYRVTNVVNAKIRNVAGAGAIIDSVAQAGGDLTRIDSINFTIDDPIRFQDEAREKAMADAADKAKRLAELAGVKLGKAIFISESGVSPIPPAPIFARAGLAEDAGTSISPGEMEIVLNIQVVYGIR